MRMITIATTALQVAAAAALLGAGRADASPPPIAPHIAPAAAPDTAAEPAVDAGHPPCRWEDGSGQRSCVWDARHNGNGRGRSLFVRRGGTEDARVERVPHAWAHEAVRVWRTDHCERVAPGYWACTGWRWVR